MKTLYVYADFDWLDEPMLVGELGYESLRAQTPIRSSMITTGSVSMAASI